MAKTVEGGKKRKKGNPFKQLAVSGMDGDRPVVYTVEFDTPFGPGKAFKSDRITQDLLKQLRTIKKSFPNARLVGRSK